MTEMSDEHCLGTTSFFITKCQPIIIGQTQPVDTRCGQHWNSHLFLPTFSGFFLGCIIFHTASGIQMMSSSWSMPSSCCCYCCYWRLPDGQRCCLPQPIILQHLAEVSSMQRIDFSITNYECICPQIILFANMRKVIW